MNDLYTSQIHLKRILAGEATAAFTQPSAEVLEVLDLAFFPGLGAFNENDEGLLQCPLRGCGRFTTMLAHHLHCSHPAFGGPARLRELIGVSKQVPLMSARVREKMRSSFGEGRGGNLRERKTTQKRIARHVAPKGLRPMMSRNHADTCPAQLDKQLTILAAKLGRSPSANDFKAEYGTKGIQALCRVFGTWNNAKAAAGLSTYRSGGTPGMNGKPFAEVVESLRTWVSLHGDLPTTIEAQDRERTPYIPTVDCIQRVFGVTSWFAAMRVALSHIEMDSARYGFLKDTRTERAA